MQNSKKRISAFLSVVIAAVFVLSVVFVVFESEHHCSGEDCHICQTLISCLNNINNLTPDPNVTQFSAFAVFAVVLLIGSVCVKLNINNLVLLKVKLSE